MKQRFKKVLHWITGKNKKNRSRVSYISIWIRNLVLFFFVSTFLSVLIMRFVPIRLTPLMALRVCHQLSSDRPVKLEQTWLCIDDMSSTMIDAVIASEDNKFMSHNGFDFEAIEKARKMNKKGKKIYGASTISQQVAKNVFLWPDRTWVRKGLEVYFTVMIETFWSKKRIMEVYLNVAEMGDGIYGVEAASQCYFRHSASKLTMQEAASLASVLPAPLAYNPRNIPQKLIRKQGRIVALMKKLNKSKWGLHY